MLTDILWYSGIALLAAQLILAAIRGVFPKYAVFYTYLSMVLGISLSRLLIYHYYPGAYLSFYWYTQFLSIAAGYGVTWEIYTQTFKSYPGTARMARFMVSSVFVGVVAKTALPLLLRQTERWTTGVIELERNFRTVQAVLLIVVLLLIFHYRIPLSRNLKGILWGYGVFVGSAVIVLALRSQIGPGFQTQQQYLQQISYLLALSIWMVALRSYQPSSVPEYKVQLEGDYQFVAERTLQAITRARAYLLRATLS